MTKDQLIKRNEMLEQEIHNAQNSVDYHIEESDKWMNMYNKLNNNVNSNNVLHFLKTCSLTQAMEIEDFIKKLTKD